ncbi:hypothetical protein LAU_0185 [Lausannevirus]|uniref:MORN repeat-containing protein n=2 Tax=Lausannevirus TaxID=999883 RepID=A0A0N9PW76_9VIRU|nr:hypothetical protein LAU_0185 [Lausannevirus]AEA07036.1 hypothetical protein LAU_0185 [Lausannevirus]ALH06862.1 hypothetical protein PMV_164 [Port-miou virus]
METFLSNKEILPFLLTTDVEVREEEIKREIPSKVQAFWSREPVDVLLLYKRKSTFSFRKGTNIKHGPFSSVIEHGRKRGNGPEIYNKLTRVRGRYVDGKLEGEKEETFYFLKRGEEFVLCGTTTTTYKRGVKHGMQTVKNSEDRVVTRLYQNGEKDKETQQ